jgi:hypothetical protein
VWVQALLALLLTCAGGGCCDAARIVVEARGQVGDGWSVSGVGCRSPEGSGSGCAPVHYDDIHAHVGDTLLFRYAWFHDVFLSTLSEKNCDFSSGRVVAGVGAGGGDGFQYMLTDPGTFIFSCTRSGNRPGWEAIGSHCASGQVVRVVVTRPTSTSDGGSVCSLDGTWDTTYQEVQVQGHQGSYMGVWGAISQIEWSSTPNVVVGQFHNADLNADGHFSWTLDDDCDSFTGEYGWDGQPASGRWDGNRISSSAAASTNTVPGFVGPFEGMGISGFNDLGNAPAHGPTECAGRCADLAACQSFDWGARDGVRGECWLSTANRASAGGAYTHWPLYDYYEKAAMVGGRATEIVPPQTTTAAQTPVSSGLGGTDEHDHVVLRLPPVITGLVLAAALGLSAACIIRVCRSRCENLSRGVDESSGPTTVVVQAAPVLPLPLRGEVVSLCPVSADTSAGTTVVVAEEMKASDLLYARGGGGGGGGGSTAVPGMSRRCSV